MSDVKVSTKKRQRGAIRANATKEIKKAEGLILAVPFEPGPAEASVGKLSDYRKELRDYSNSFLSEELDDDSVEQEIKSTSEYDEKILDCIEKLKAKIKESCSAVRGRANSDATRGSKSVKLPKLEMEKFSGDPIKFQEFLDSFTTTIHDNENLSDVDKFKYLRNYLTGDAMRLLEGYRLTSANYKTALDALKERFGNPQVAIFSHLTAMIEMPAASHDIGQLQAVYDECERHVRSLVALGLAESTFGQVFTPIILSKLPTYVKMELHRKIGSESWTLAKLRQMLKDEIRVREMSHRYVDHKQLPADSKQTPARPGKFEVKNAKKNGQGHATTSMLPTNVTKAPRCRLCDGSHFTDECTEYKDLTSRLSKLKGLCYNCLKPGHTSTKCKLKTACYHCKRLGHHRSLCREKFGKKPDSRQNVVVNSDSDLNPNASVFTPVALNPQTNVIAHGESVNLQTAVTRICNTAGTKVATARLLFDTAGSRSYITTEMFHRISGQSTGEECVSMAGFEDDSRKVRKYKVTEFDVVLADGQKQRISANVTKTITCPVEIQPIDTKKYPFLKLLQLAESPSSKPAMFHVDVLIGGDHYYDFIGGEQIRCADGFVLLESTLGYITAGRSPKQSSGTSVGSTLLITRADYNMKQFDIQRFWSLDHIGIKESDHCSEDDLAMQNFKDTVKYNARTKRYQVSWPWKSDDPDLPCNYSVALFRLKGLVKRLQANPQLFNHYEDVIRGQREAGIVEKVEREDPGSLIHYLPHHGVVKPDRKTTKLRVVYDASSKATASLNSLNECLHRGPVMLEDMCGILIRFRLHKTAMVADIEKAFLQIELLPNQRDVTRFLWLKHHNRELSKDNIVVYRFTRLLFGVISSPFLLAVTIQHHLAANGSGVATKASNDMYVDNLVTGFSNAAQATEFYGGVKEIFAGASMNLRQWYTNDPDFLKCVPDVDRGEDVTTGVLGLQWNTNQDTLSCFTVLDPLNSITSKRLVLKNMAKIFDPLGWFGPITVRCKLLIREMWQAKLDWDQTLPPKLQERYNTLYRDILEITTSEVPRMLVDVSDNDGKTHELHCFTDASLSAYAATIFLRSIDPGGKISTSLIFSKTRVSPIRPLTVPKLELIAAVIGVRLISFVESHLHAPIFRKVLWTDATCVLWWVKCKSVSTVFVENRLREIKSHNDISFKYVPSLENPADLPTRGCSFDTLRASEKWWYGPTYLSQDESNWPHQPDFEKETQDDIEWAACKGPNVSMQAAVCSEVTTETVPSVTRFSTLKRMLRVTGWMLRFSDKARRRVACSDQNLSADEVQRAKLCLIKQLQTLSFVGKSSNHGGSFRGLNPFVDSNGVIRCRGRFGNSALSLDAREPILLPKNHRFTDLVVMNCHAEVHHRGLAQSLAQVRQNFWIPQGRSVVKRVIRDCRICRRLSGGPFRTPEPPDLPDFRVTRDRPFNTVGLDYLGPLFIRSGINGEKKAWVCLFTCTVTRAIHLEVLQDMSAEQFLLCLRRFCAIQNEPRLIISDNAKQFRSAATAMRSIWQDVYSSDVQAFSATKGIHWKFITEKAPWMGGFYERLIGVVKRSLLRTIHRRKLTITELQTVVAEIGAMVNSRPLAYVHDEVGFEAITPLHLLGKPPSKRWIDIVEDGEDEFRSEPYSTTDDVILSWKRIKNRLDEFWQMWSGQYLLSLREAHGTSQKRTSVFTPLVGGIVLIKDNNRRIQWKLAEIVELIPSSDGACRSARVRTSNGRIIRRPIKLLCPLEVDGIPSGQIIGSDPPKSRSVRPSRTAANEAKIKIRRILSNERSDEDSGSSQ